MSCLFCGYSGECNCSQSQSQGYSADNMEIEGSLVTTFSQGEANFKSEMQAISEYFQQNPHPKLYWDKGSLLLRPVVWEPPWWQFWARRANVQVGYLYLRPKRVLRIDHLDYSNDLVELRPILAKVIGYNIALEYTNQGQYRLIIPARRKSGEETE